MARFGRCSPPPSRPAPPSSARSKAASAWPGSARPKRQGWHTASGSPEGSKPHRSRRNSTWPQTELIADGKRHAIAVTDYVLERIRDRRLTPAAVDRCDRRQRPQACKRDAGGRDIPRGRGHLGSKSMGTRSRRKRACARSVLSFETRTKQKSSGNSFASAFTGMLR